MLLLLLANEVRWLVSWIWISAVVVWDLDSFWVVLVDYPARHSCSINQSGIGTPYRIGNNRFMSVMAVPGCAFIQQSDKEN